jgi:hypothetical protein
MGRGLGPYEREVLQRIGKHKEMFGDAKVVDIAKEMALARGLVALVVDGMGTENELDVAHAIGLRHALAMLERRGLVTCHVGGWVELTGAAQPWWATARWRPSRRLWRSWEADMIEWLKQARRIETPAAFFRADWRRRRSLCRADLARPVGS